MSQAWVAAEHRSGDLVHRDAADLVAWHARVAQAEPVLDPDLAIVDAHHHLWDRPSDRYSIEEFDAEIAASGHRVLASVFVECRWHFDESLPQALQPVGESRHVTALAKAHGGQLASGIAAYADLTLGEAADAVLEAHLAACGARFKGVRHRAVFDAHVRPNTRGLRAGLLADAAFRRGIAVLSHRGLSFDAWAYFTQLQELVDLARAFPDLSIVVNHTGGMIGVGPYARSTAEVVDRWRSGIDALARCDNVTMKLGGLGMLHCGFDFHYRDRPPSSQQVAQAWRPWIESCIEGFGAQRCMFESNFPVDKQTASYRVVWNAFKRIAQGASAEEKHALFFDTANRVYRLGLPRPAQAS